MIERKRNKDEKASSVQIGFVINTGIMTVFISIMLVILGGGFGEDLSTEEELQSVAEEVKANMVDADRLAQTEGEFEGFFEPPSSGVDYTARVGTGGDLELTAPDGSLVEEDLDEITETDVSTSGSEIEFTERDRNIIVDGNSTDIVISVQKGESRRTNVSE